MSQLDAKPPVIAAIDVGTNSFHMVIASVDSKGMLNIITRDKEMVRLGESGFDMKYLTEEAVQRGVEAMNTFAKIAASEKAMIRAVATSAVREALNRNLFLDKVKETSGVDIEVVSGAEEGRLIYIGSLHALPIYPKKALVIDIGGGSTETIIGYKGDIQFVHSEKLGAIRVTSRFFDNGISNKESIRKCREYIKGYWSPVLKAVETEGFEIVVGTSGTITTLASMALAAKNEPIPDVLNGLIIDAGDILDVIENIIQAGTPKQRALLPGMDPKRADIIIGGAMILEYAILRLNIKKFLISPYAMREGIVFDTMQKMKEINEYKHLTHLRFETINNLCQRYSVEPLHSQHVKNTSLKIFDALAEFHKLGNLERELLEAAALLHDCGYHISHDQHHKHSYYLITHSDMPGFTNDEAEIIGNIARYHRKSHPKKKHIEFSSLHLIKQTQVRILSGILRLAEGIDRRRQQYVSDVKFDIQGNNISLELTARDLNNLPDIEIWGVNRRKGLLEEALGININVKELAVI